MADGVDIARMILTIDGPAGSGKSTVARRVARELGLPLLYSGSIYRAVTLCVIERGGDFADRSLVREVVADLDLRFRDDPAGGSPRVFLGERDITERLTDHDVTSSVYRVANDAGYRSLLVGLQRDSARAGGVVAEGRDMGTVIFPEADVKVYLEASASERARRRQEEDRAAGRDAAYADVLEAVRRRDRHDIDRDASPLRVPPGALVIDTDGMDVAAVVKRVLEAARQVEP